MNTTIPETSNPSDLSKFYSEQIAKNLKKLLQTRDISQNDLARTMKEHGLNINQGTISKYLSGKIEIPLGFIVKLCEAFNVTLPELISDNFISLDREIFTDEASVTHPRREDSVLFIPRLGKKFITDPSDIDFSGYLQNYYCYFFPTLSGENNILKGTLNLGGGNPKSNVCEASLILDTNQKIKDDTIYKTYTGCAIISTSVHAMYVILSSPDEGEICLINFRHFFIRHRLLDCRMAEVITNAAGESHAPTVHRMLISRQEISNGHLEYIKPHLHLNSNDIFISEEDLQSFCNESENHKRLIDHLTYTTNTSTLYSFKEDFVRSNALQFLSKEQLPLFLSRIRHNSYKMRYNKVSSRADENVHKLLTILGYFSD